MVRLSQSLLILKAEVIGNLNPEFIANSIPFTIPTTSMTSHVYMRQTQAFFSTLPESPKIQFFIMPANCSLVYGPLIKTYHSCSAMENLRRASREKEPQDLPRTIPQDHHSTLTDLKFHDSINHFFSWCASLPYVLLISTCFITCQ